MESVDFNDRYLDPPDGALTAECDECGEEFLLDDLFHDRHLHILICFQCLEIKKLESVS